MSGLAVDIPAPVTPLVGRGAELDVALTLLVRGGVRLVTLTGPGGVGKTRLALAASDAARAEFDSCHFVSLAPVREPGQVPAAIAEGLALPERPAARAALDRVVAYLRPARALLVLDNFEHLLDAAPLVAALLMACPRLAVLATSREALHLRGEHELPVAPLPLPAHLDPAAELEASMASPAVELLRQRARAVDPAFVVDAGNVAAVAAICARLEGLPLAIELAAARLKYLSPAALLARLEPRLPELAAGPRDAPARQRTMRGAIAWSDGLLEEAERRLFYAAAVFRDGLTAPGAVAVGGDGRIGSPTGQPSEVAGAEVGLTSLADKSLLRAEPAPAGTPRFAMLEVVREYALERLAAAGALEEARRRHAAYFVALAEGAQPALDGPEQGAWLARLDADRENLRAALAWAAERGEVEAGLRLAGALETFWYARNHAEAERAGLETLLAATGPAAEAIPPAVRGAAQITAGMLARVGGDDARARARFEAARDCAREDGDRRGEAQALNRLGVLAFERGDLAAAEILHAEALAIQRGAGDRQGVASSLAHLGLAVAQRGDDARAREAFEESLALDRDRGSVTGVARALGGLGDLARRAGDLDRAAGLYEECLALFRALGDGRRTAYVLGHLAEVATDRGDDARAFELLEEGVTLHRDHGARRGLAGALSDLGGTLSRLGDRPRAAALLAEGLGLHREVGNPMGIADTLTALGLSAARGGDLAAALASLREGAAVCRRIGDPLRAARCLEALAEVAAAQHQPVRAARLLGTAAAVREASHRPLPPARRGAQARTLAAVRVALGRAAFDAAWARGKATPLADALDAAAAPPPLHPAAPPPAPRPPDGLTPREAEVLRLLANGLTNPEIAADLSLSVRTVERHINNLYGKLRVRGRTEATAYAFRRHLVDADPA
jgi:non-specific serine/threonine protein kinase